MVNTSLFFQPQSKRLARIISIKSPSVFRQSIAELVKGGLSLKERQGLVLAKNRAKVQLKRKNLSAPERKEFLIISQMVLPSVSRKK